MRVEYYLDKMKFDYMGTRCLSHKVELEKLRTNDDVEVSRSLTSKSSPIDLRDKSSQNK